MNSFIVHILAADKPFYEGECESLIIPTSSGQYGVEAYHSNMIAAIIPGIMKFRIPGEKDKIAAVSDGMIKVEDNDVLVLVDTAEYPEEIDINRAKRAAAESKESILQKHSIREYKFAHAQMARAMSRLRAKNMQ